MASENNLGKQKKASGTGQITKIGPKNIPPEEPFAQGHRACQGCGEAQALRLIMKAAGKDSIVSNATGCMEIVSSPLPLTSWDVPYIHVAFENTAAVASGVESALKVLMRKGRISKKKIFSIAVAGDGGTSDIGLQALSGAMERGHDMLYVCLDNEAYMNTGIQRSSSTPYGAMTTTSPPGSKSIGQGTWKKNMAEIMVAHDIPYVATACHSYPWDLMNKVRKALAIEGPAYLHVLSVCPTGWRSDPALSIELGKLAVRTRVFPLYEVERGRYRLTPAPPKKKPVEDYLKPQGRFRHLTAETIAEIQMKVDSDFERLERRVAVSQELEEG